ncbi:hypothetical protein NWQ33_00665 [Mycoplasmopsis cynos]|nr:hypothetical protein [Mycoplasmopsis cynos]
MKAPTVITTSKSFEETQYVYAFKDTPVKEALKSQIDQGWMFENLEEVSQQDNAKNTDNSNTSGTQESFTRTGEETPRKKHKHTCTTYTCNHKCW